VTKATGWRNLVSDLSRFGETGVGHVDPDAVRALQQRIVAEIEKEPLPVLAIALAVVLINAINMMIADVESGPPESRIIQ